MTSSGRSLSRILLLSALVLPAWAGAQLPSSPIGAPPAIDPASGYGADPTYQRHLGFFFRPELGFGYATSSASDAGADLTIKGGGASFAIAVGGAVTENFIVGAQAWDVVTTSPTIELGGTSASTSSDTSSGVVGYGLLLNWYFDNNFYLALTPSLTRLTFSDNGTSYTSDWGFGLRGTIGKEWWVANHWGLGVAGGLGLSSNKDGAYSGAPTWTTWGFSLNVSATYN